MKTIGSVRKHGLRDVCLPRVYLGDGRNPFPATVRSRRRFRVQSEDAIQRRDRDYSCVDRTGAKPFRTWACASQNGEWKRALELFDEMVSAPKDQGLAPNDYTYNAIISVLAHNGCLDVAAEKFKEMREVRRLPVFPTTLLGKQRRSVGGGVRDGHEVCSI